MVKTNNTTNNDTFQKKNYDMSEINDMEEGIEFPDPYVIPLSIRIRKFIRRHLDL